MTGSGIFHGRNHDKAGSTPLPEGIKIRYARQENPPRRKCGEVSEAYIGGAVEKVRLGKCRSLELSLNEYNEESCLLLESSSELIFLQIWCGETGTAWACYNPEFSDSGQEAPIEPSDGQSVFPMKCTMRDRELAVKCVEWRVRTLEPCPGMDWLRDTR